MESFVLWSLKVWPARGFNNFTSAASILRLCEAVKVQFSDPFKNVDKTRVLYNFKIVSVLTFLKIVLFVTIFITLIVHNISSRTCFASDVNNRCMRRVVNAVKKNRQLFP